MPVCMCPCVSEGGGGGLWHTCLLHCCSALAHMARGSVCLVLQAPAGRLESLTLSPPGEMWAWARNLHVTRTCYPTTPQLPIGTGRRGEGSCQEEEGTQAGCAHTSQGQRSFQHPLRRGTGSRRWCIRWGGMTLKAAEAIKMALDEGAARMANRTYHVHPYAGETWHYAFPGEEGMESIAPLPECDRQGKKVSFLARVAEEWVRETGGAEQVTLTMGVIRRARYRRGEWMTREDTKVVIPWQQRGRRQHSGGGKQSTSSSRMTEWETGRRWRSRYATGKGQGTSTIYRCPTLWSPRQRRKAWKPALGSAGKGKQYRYTPWSTGRDSR